MTPILNARAANPPFKKETKRDEARIRTQTKRLARIALARRFTLSQNGYGDRKDLDDAKPTSGGNCNAAQSKKLAAP